MSKQSTVNIFQAARDGDFEEITQFLSEGGNINKISVGFQGRNWFPLDFAINSPNNEKTIELLLSHGATWAADHLPYNYNGESLDILDDIRTAARYMSFPEKAELPVKSDNFQKYGKAIVARFALLTQQDGIYSEYKTFKDHLTENCKHMLNPDDLSAACRIIDNNMHHGLDFAIYILKNCGQAKKIQNLIKLLESDSEEGSCNKLLEEQIGIWSNFFRNNKYPKLAKTLESFSRDTLSKDWQYDFSQAVISMLSKLDMFYLAKLRYDQNECFTSFKNLILPHEVVTQLDNALALEKQFFSNPFQVVMQTRIVHMQQQQSETDQKIEALTEQIKLLMTGVKGSLETSPAEDGVETSGDGTVIAHEDS